jgi:hypothetical protein
VRVGRGLRWAVVFKPFSSYRALFLKKNLIETLAYKADKIFE